ncbi:hypothetical protein QR680_016588 [Steinernema hermaphroditum]|uniref:Uncharacterized protein n=1 Tax=Steinernema hermaphroditum TaxID=289476 RepID=A0AA39LMP3_9BILA|nr:hypothetical protein QR680_016588 [Steinernema hermaphroditum]
MEKPKKRKKTKKKRCGNVPYIPEGQLKAAVPRDVQKNMQESPEEFDNDPKKTPPPKKDDETTSERTTEACSPPGSRRTRNTSSIDSSKPSSKKDDDLTEPTSEACSPPRKPQPEFAAYSDLHKYPLPVIKKKRDETAKPATINRSEAAKRIEAKCSPQVIDVLLHANKLIRMFSNAHLDGIDLLIALKKEHDHPKVTFVLGRPLDVANADSANLQ